MINIRPGRITNNRTDVQTSMLSDVDVCFYMVLRFVAFHRKDVTHTMDGSKIIYIDVCVGVRGTDCSVE